MKSRKRRKRAKRNAKKRKLHQVWLPLTLTTGRAHRREVNRMKEWDITNWLMCCHRKHIKITIDEIIPTLCHFRQHLRCRWRILRSLLCVRPAEMQRSSAGSPETGEAWRRAFTQLTTCTWRRRMAKGFGLLQNNLLQSFSPLIVALMIDPVFLSCHVYIFLLIVCLCLFLIVPSPRCF